MLLFAIAYAKISVENIFRFIIKHGSGILSDRSQNCRARIVAVVLDIIVAGNILLIFAYFHHVREVPVEYQGISVVDTVSASDISADASAVPSDTDAEAEQPEDFGGDFTRKFPDKFTDGEIVETETSYMSSKVNVSYRDFSSEIDGLSFNGHVIDVYVGSYDLLQTALAGDSFGTSMNHCSHTLSIAKKKNAVAAMNGDYYSARRIGPVVRNGVMFRDTPDSDIFVMYTDGSMKAFEKGTYNDLDYTAGNIWNVWSFGPSLLTADGGTKTTFNSILNEPHPRSAIGYYEPGHYCFVAVDGRGKGGSEGISLEAFSQMFHDMGCTAAYNVDGGRTSVLEFNGTILNNPPGGGARPCSDIIYIPKE